MANDLANLFGDHSQSLVSLTSKNLSVLVQRRGEEVRIAIGNADPITLDWKTAFKFGQRLMVEGHLAIKRREIVQIKFGRHELRIGGRDAVSFGQQMQARAAEIKFLVGETKRCDIRG